MDPNLLLWIERLQAGDETAFEKVKAQYDGLLHSQVSQAIGRIPGGELDDLMQEAALALFDAAMRYNLQQKDVTFGLFAKICIRNRLISVARRMNKSRTSSPAASGQDELSSSARKAARRAVYRDLEDVAKQVLSSLEYKVYCLYLNGESAVEIAQHLDISLKSADNAIYRMRRKIKEQCVVIPSSDPIDQ